MTSYLVLMRGINVGGKNLIPMAGLRQVLEALGFAGVATYLQSGNAVVQSELAAEAVASRIEAALPAAFRLDSALIKVLVLSQAQLQAVIDDRPKGFGDTPDLYHSDAIFLMRLGMAEALAAFSPKEGVDTIWPGKGVIYSQRLSALRTKSRLNRMMASPLYLSMTIRSWGTVLKLAEMMAVR
ncbi:DUF1697 domain-containing protein [Devosia ginsengisoli]|uniref:DUF1697 domain-containing protein n=1 Tax=Devosia ginsengisoli TaxID=400770 RepID=UPI0026ED851A|nr:DUF1697 domain-containing protein [Devosia ginsengisoli]MCR6670998.1 DUF1697 domain-containing protein [Devosia ginsengisoli]